MMALVWALLLTTLLFMLAACASPPPPPRLVVPPALPPAPPTEVVILLPNADGTTGQITVVAGGVEYLLDRPYAALTRTSEGRVVPGVRTSEEVQMLFGPTLQARPPPPVQFSLLFEFGTDTLTPSSTREVEQIMAEIKRYPAPEIVLIGHTDKIGSERDNDALSVQRAGRVREGLIRRGIPADMIEVVGRGKRDATGDAAKDRRVDVIVR